MSERELPRISVVVPSYNQGHFLGAALESIFRQEYPRLEVVVMDGGSTDDSVAVIRRHEDRLKYWQSQADGGQSAAINAGMKHCGGELVAWLNSDDFYWGDALWTVGRAYAAAPDHGLYLGNGLRYLQAQETYVPFNRRHMTLQRQALIHGIDYILQPSAFFLRRAWHEVGGLKPELCYCMDWDIFIRIAARYPAVLINEFLGVSREYEETKTRTGGLKRAIEIVRMIQTHTEQELTPGSMLYLLQTVVDVTEDVAPPEARRLICASTERVATSINPEYGTGEFIPDRGDPQDYHYVPITNQGEPRHHRHPDSVQLPSVSIVIPALKMAQFVRQSLESLHRQEYPNAEMLVVGELAADFRQDLTLRYGNRLTYCDTDSDTGPARAINLGLAQAKGEILAWMNPGDMLTPEALWEVGRSFTEDKELDLLHGNALYIDERNEIYSADQGGHRSAFCYGDVKTLQESPISWSDLSRYPCQATVFFRRRLWEACGRLDDSLTEVFALDLLYRFAKRGKIQKLERTQALELRPPETLEPGPSRFLAHFYRFSRSKWPMLPSAGFGPTLRRFVKNYMQRGCDSRKRGIRFWAKAALVALSAVTCIGNPEQWTKASTVPRGN